MIRKPAQADDAGAPVNAGFGHMREPVLFMANILRSLNATLGTSSAIYNQATQTGQQLFYSPSVFSYFSPQYRTRAGDCPSPRDADLYDANGRLPGRHCQHYFVWHSRREHRGSNLTAFTPERGDASDSLLNYIGGVFMHGGMFG